MKNIVIGIMIKKTDKTGHLHQLEGKALVKDAVDLRATRQVGGVHLISRPFDALLKVHGKLLHHPADCAQYTGKVLTSGTAEMCICECLHPCVRLH